MDLEMQRIIVGTIINPRIANAIFDYRNDGKLREYNISLTVKSSIETKKSSPHDNIIVSFI